MYKFIPVAQASPLDSQSLNAIIQLGAIGVLLLLGIALVLWIARKPNTTPVDTAVGTNAAINALAEAITASNNRLDTTLEAQKEKDISDREQDKELNERYIESISAQADATNNLVDVLRKQSSDSLTIKEDLHIMTTQGSKPLNELIQKFDEIKDIVVAIKETSDNDRKSYEKLLADVADMKEIVIRMEAKRATSEINKVTLNVPSPLPVEIVDQ